MAYEDLERLHDLHAKGALTDEEFACEKAKVLGREEPAALTATSPYWGMGRDSFLMLMHLSPSSGATR